MPFAFNPNDGVRIHYEVEGDGPALVLYHPTTSSGDGFRDAGYVDRLKDRFQIVLLDARAHGRSAGPHDEKAYCLLRLVEDVVAVLDEVGVDMTHFYGYSLGGRVGYGLGHYAPERVKSLILAGGNYLPTPDFGETFLASLRAGGMRRLTEDWEASIGQRLPGKSRERLLAMDAEAFAAYIRQTRREPSLQDALPDMNVPTLLINVGHHPERYEQSREALNLLPDARLIENPGGDDDILFDRVDLIEPLIREFAEEVEALER